jgi:transcriptional regulator with XRE-family HTH domain
MFGAFLKEKRNGRAITLRAMAGKIGVGYGYYSDLESGRRTPIDLEFLDRIKTALNLSEEESQMMYDLAGKAREAAPPDLTRYLNDTPKARVALRVAKETATDEDWERFIKDLEKKGR